ncbi:MAG: TetR/AcrR family transcriptional regulator C-terminal domain-containing protein [Trebonia sp.]
MSRTAIVDRALAVADLEGTDAVTVRRLAQEFGVTPMALYWHVKNKDELLGAMGDRFFDDVEPMPASGTWADRLHTTVRSLVESLRQHPASAHLSASRVLQCPAGREIAEDTLATLRAAGFSITQATDIARTAMQTAVMLVTEQAGAEPGVPAEKRDAVRTAKHQAIAGLPPDRFPNLVDCAAAMTNCEDEQAYYDFGIDLFVAGVERLHATLKRNTRKG